MNINFWKNRRVLITGSTGFKGGWLAAWLNLLGADVFGFGLEPTTNPSFFKAYNLSSKIYNQYGDIRDDALFTYVDNVKPSVIFHLAAQSLVRRSYTYPIETFDINVNGTAKLLTASRNHSCVQAIIVVTSDKCYEPTRLSNYKEDDPLGGFDPYSASKACQEIITKAYYKSFFENSNCAIATVRAGNVIGGGDWAEERLIPDIIRAVQSDKILELRYPHAIRPWQYVLEPLHGYIKLMENLVNYGRSWSGAWNFGPANLNLTVEELTVKIFDLWGKTFEFKKTENNLKETICLELNSSKARNQLGWEPKLTLEEGLNLTVDWYRQYYDNPKTIIDTTNNQIIDYMAT